MLSSVAAVQTIHQSPILKILFTMNNFCLVQYALKKICDVFVTSKILKKKLQLLVCTAASEPDTKKFINNVGGDTILELFREAFSKFLCERRLDCFR